MPRVHRPRARRHGGDLEAAVRRGLGEMASRHDLHERHHAGMNVAEDTHQTGFRERPGPGLAAAVLPEVERTGLGGREYVVVERVVILEAGGGADGDDHDAGHVLLIVDRDVDGDRPGRGISWIAFEVYDRRPEVGR